METDPDHLDEETAEAWRIARDLAASLPVTDWPELPIELAVLPPRTAAQIRRVANECYLAGMILCALTTDGSFFQEGVRLTFPALIDAGCFEIGDRQMSWETLLTAVDDERAPQMRKLVGYRLRRLAEICLKED